MSSSRPIVILGGGGHARVVADACVQAGRPIAGFLDPTAAAGDDRHGIAVLGGDELLDAASFRSEHDVIVAIGDQEKREQLARAVSERGASLASVVHPRAVVADGVRIGPGTVVLAGAVVNPGSSLGGWVVVNTHATIDHDDVLEDGVHVCPGAALAGEVICRRGAVVGTGACVVPGITIGELAVVGAGAVVVEDVPPGATVVGNPARVVRRDRSG